MDDLETFRKRAKQLVRDHRAGLVTVAERIRRHLPDLADATDREVLAAPFALHEAQQIVAAELGFADWLELSRAPALPQPPADAAEVAWHAYAQVFVGDLVRALTWYRDVLGFRVDYTYGRPPFHAQVSRDAVAFNLRWTAAPPWATPPADDDLLAVRIEVGDVKALYLELRERGAELHQPLRREPWGQRTFVVRDPDGNLVSFGSPMPRPFLR